MKILVCPLDWGLGHAARCIPLIRALIRNGHEVRIGAAGGGKRLLESEFPGLEIFDFPGYPIRYARTPAFFLPVMLAQLPKVFLGMLAESRGLARILAAHPCDLVISDGRYGVFTRSLPCIFITHQVFIRVPGRFPGALLAERILLAMNLRLLRRFRRVWVPDYPGTRGLSGDLSHKPCSLATLEFIHPLSRFPDPGSGTDPDTTADAQGGAGIAGIQILAVVSGPEPQRGLFEALLRKRLADIPGTRVLVRGLPGKVDSPRDPGMDRIRMGELNVFDHLPGAFLARLFAAAELVVARSGYTTVMEMAAMRVKAAVLVPTPGQSEQEYLADHLHRSGTALRMDQDALELKDIGARLAKHGPAGFAPRGGNPGEEGFSLSEFLKRHPLLSAPEAARNPDGTVSAAQLPLRERSVREQL